MATAPRSSTQRPPFAARSAAMPNAPWPPADLARLGSLGRILLARHDQRTAERTLRAAIAAARADGHTWPEIARLLRDG